MKKLSLEDMLIQEKIINLDQLKEVNKIQKRTGQATFHIILDQHFAKETDVLKILAKSLEMEYIDNLAVNVNPDSFRVFPETLASKYHMAPLRVSEGTLTLATSNPFNLPAIEDISVITGMNVHIVLSTKEEIENTNNRFFRTKSLPATSGTTTSEEFDQDDEESLETSPAVKLVNTMIIEAYKKNASDIHIEPELSFTRVRLRIDGDMIKHSDFDKDMHSLISTRIKILSGLNIAEKRLPQDGSFQFSHDFKKIDIRVSTLPTPYGENIVMRLLGADQNIEYSLSGLGLSKKSMNIIEKAIKVPHGIILITGPTGSGKTTTLYSMLAKLATPQRTVKTIEDPIERKFDGITQVQVNQKAGLTFATGLRSILRQDPDIIMIGEIRDVETAEIAIRAAITGHLVLSTIHTNDALSTVTRLVDMGIENFMVASSIVCVISQRLVKRICIHCKETVDLTLSEQGMLHTNLKTAYRGKGCDRCNHTGYTGRAAAFEIVLIDPKLEEMIVKDASVEDMREYAQQKQMRILRDELSDYVAQGVTTVDEALRVLFNTEI